MHRGNPFSTRYVRPGALPYRFADGADVSQLMQQLQQHGWWGQIVGEHGTGKTTLLHALAEPIRQAGRTLHWCTLQAGQRSLSARFWQARGEWSANCQIVVDGYEQLGWWARIRLRHRCRKARAGLLVTSHQDAGLPQLCNTRCSLDTLQQLVEQLLRRHQETTQQSGASLPVVDHHDVRRFFRAWKGNVREVLFSLYDLYELRRQDH